MRLAQLITPPPGTAIGGATVENLLGPIASALDPSTVMPLACYLVSEACELSHEVFSVGGGRFARVFVGLAPGWFAGKGKVVSLEDVRDNLAQIMDEKNYIVPKGVGDEMRLIAKDLLG